jgi:uncharacterized protein YxeA
MSPLSSWILIAVILIGSMMVTLTFYALELERENKYLKRELDLAQPPF